MVKTYSLSCPNCGATVEAKEHRSEMFCEYCGTKILLNDDSVKTINLKSDTIEAIAKDRAERKEQLRKEQKDEEEKNGRAFEIRCLIFLGLCAVYFLLHHYGII